MVAASGGTPYRGTRMAPLWLLAVAAAAYRRTGTATPDVTSMRDCQSVGSVDGSAGTAKLQGTTRNCPTVCVQSAGRAGQRLLLS